MLIYTVTIELPDEPLVEEVLAWLEGDHLGDVVRAGALRGEASRVDGAPVVECRYWFASREAFEVYESGPAEALRADGRARFGPERGARMSRAIAEVRVVRQGS